MRGLSAAELRSSAFLTSALEIHRTSSISVSSMWSASLFAFAMHPIISSQEPPLPAYVHVHPVTCVQEKHRDQASLHTWLWIAMPRHYVQYSLWQPGLAQSTSECAVRSATQSSAGGGELWPHLWAMAGSLGCAHSLRPPQPPPSLPWPPAGASKTADCPLTEILVCLSVSLTGCWTLTSRCWVKSSILGQGL